MYSPDLNASPLIRPMAAASGEVSLGEAQTVDRARHRKIVSFFTVNFLRFLWWEVVLRRFFGEGFVKRGRTNRYRVMARRFRALAVEMGGVMIKLGQFISTRVDILPETIIRELEGLQDEVPPVGFEQIRQLIFEQLGATAGELRVESKPIAAASFGQVHRARLNGEKVVVKVQRPQIRGMVQTDLSALGVVAGRAMRWKFISRRADVPKLLEEFARVLWEELDYVAEANHAERFARMFDHDLGVYVPKVYREYSGRRVLVLEDVSAIKINDYAALEAAGIDRNAVARRLLDTYLTQVFKERFFHADPHPGNVFIYPLPPDAAAEMDFNTQIDNGNGTPFYVIFVDYGMIGRLTPQVVEALRQTLIALGLRDARGLVESYDRLGLLMPDADRERIIEATRRAFDLVWGLDMSQLGSMSYGEVAQFGKEFSDLMFSMPFRIPQDLIYLGRCTGILSGMCTGLDPRFDPWKEMQPYVATLLEAGSLDDAELERRSVMMELRGWLTPQNIRAILSEESADLAIMAGRDYTLRALQLPLLMDDILRKAERGELQTRIRFDADLEQRFRQLEHANNRLVGAIVCGALLVSSSLLWVSGAELLSGLGVILTGVAWIRFMWWN